jgi:phosphoglycerol geranylgeranyltransferase
MDRKRSLMSLYEQIASRDRKRFAVLVDPDKLEHDRARRLAALCNESQVDFIFAGGSLMLTHRMDDMVHQLKQETNIPIIIFPGNSMQISSHADGILLLSLISGRNPEMLIGRHVEAAPRLKQSALEIIPTGYMLVESGDMTTAVYMSNSLPIPRNKPDVAACTAMAGEMLGLKVFYLDAGSGAPNPVSYEMIAAVSAAVSSPVIVGGGIKTPEQCTMACNAGADIVVVGNAIEDHPTLIKAMSKAIHSQKIQNHTT